MLRVDHIKGAVDDLVAAALLGEGWEAALSGFAHAAGAQGALMMRNRPDRLLATIATDDLVELVSSFNGGLAPPSSRHVRVSSSPRVGFRIDQHDFTAEELAKDSFYQEFLRPRGLFWHANAVLVGGDEWVELSLKRPLTAGPYERQDAAALDAVLPELSVTAWLAKRTLDGAALGMARLLERRGEPIYQLDAWGRVLSTEAIDEADGKYPVSVIGHRLVAADRAAQEALDRAVTRAVGRPPAITLASFGGPDGRRYFLQIVPVPGRARDVFLAAAAIAVLIDAGGPPLRMRLDASTIGHALALTDREADVACLLAEGLTPVDIAERLGMQVATVRVHLRSIFEKTGTSRQAELVALLGRLRP